MRYLRFRHVVAAGSLALIATAPLAACGDPSVSPLPAQAAEAGTSAAPGPGASVRAARPTPATTRQPAKAPPVRTSKPAPAKPTATASPSTCFGAVRHDLDLHNTALELVKSMCFHTGGVLRLQGIGPGLVTAMPGTLVSQSYEGGVVDLRFVRPGTVTVTIAQDDRTYPITVVVVA
jgi:hypothetical protein